jgi:hypothetical protein
MVCSTEHFLQVGAHHSPKFGKLNGAVLSREKLTAKFSFKFLYGPRQSRLTHMAAICRAMEVQRFADSEKVSDLVHFHRRAPDA